MELSAEEERQRKLVGVMIMCFSFFGSFLLGNYVIREHLWPSMFASYLTMALVTGPVILWTVTSYWKQ